MTDSLSAVLRSLQAAGLDIDAESALDAVWLGLRMRERRGVKAEEAQTGQAQPIGGSTSPGAGDATQLTEDDIALRRDTRLARTGEFATPLPSPSTQVPARALTLTRAAALPDSRGLIRALRPLRRRVATPGSRALDIETTVRRAAEEDLWIPSFYPTRERWLDVLLVVDHGLSMILWKDTIDEFERALRNSGAFRTVRSWWLESDRDTIAVSARRRAPTPAKPEMLTRLVRSPGRSVILLLSDCVGARWHDGAIPNLMAEWSRSLPLALLQVTPDWFWARTALGDTVDSRFRSATAAATNGQLVWDSSPFGPSGVSTEFAKTLLRVPAATLTPNALGRLADLIAGVGREWTPGVVFDLSWQGEAPAPGPSAATPRDRVDRFLSLASSDAKRLAASYAASPVRTLGVLRLLRHDLVPESGAFAEAEVLLGGILRVRREDARWDLGPSVGLDFFPGVQPLLLDGALATDVVRVLAHAAAVAKSGLGETFTAWLTDPSSGAGLLDPESSDFAKATAESLARLGGDFARIVKSNIAPPAEEHRPRAEDDGNIAEAASDDTVLSVEFMISGRVAGVGFRLFVQQNAAELGIQGTADNLPDGRIKVLASGSEAAIDKLEELLRRGPAAAKVDQVVKTILSPEPAPSASQQTDVLDESSASPHIDWPSWELVVDERGGTMATGARVFISAVAKSGITDLFIFIHGWNNSRADARESFGRIRHALRELPETPWSRSARFGGLAVLWPSMAWPDEEDSVREHASPKRVASGQLLDAASSMGIPVQLSPDSERALEEAKHAVDSNPGDTDALEHLSSLVGALDRGDESFDTEEAPRKTGFLGSLWQGVKSTLRTASYYQMQKRASVLGRDGFRPFLAQLAEQLPELRVHVVAHSVGARLAAHGLSAPLEPDRHGARAASLTLLQAVISHHAFAAEAGPGTARPGALAAVPRRVNGPIIVTFSESDKAAGFAYPTAARVAGGDEDAPGEASNAIGALGHDGAQASRAILLKLRPVGQQYVFEDNRIFNIDASHAIASHADVFGPEVAWLIREAAGAPTI